MTLKCLLLGALLASSAFVSVNAQTYSDVTKHTGYFGNRSATITSVTTPAFDDLRDTRAGLTVIASASTAGISGTLTLATKDGVVVSESTVTLFQTSTTVINVAGPVNFQKVRFKLNAPGNASAKVNLVQSR